ncbi:MAG: toll/interleukin-1 receptor domain-containing protein, partial [Planctomycetota bacterium]|nr:toll/interleukin-1 receptor domain-containing protein [Planctomycetota bacterium]
RWAEFPKIEEDEAKLTVIIVLVDHRMVVDPTWRAAIVALSERVAKERTRRDGQNASVELLPAALHDSFYRTGPLYGCFNPVRLMGLPKPVQEATLRRAATEMTARLLRNSSGNSFRPLDVFLSHAKKDGTKIAESLRDGVRRFGQLQAWYDTNDLPFGQAWEKRMRASATETTASMVSVVTDAYPTRPWCRQEARLARTPRRLKAPKNSRVWRLQPMVAVHQPQLNWVRAIPMLEGVPRIGWNDANPIEHTELVVDRLVLEMMLSYVHQCVAKDLDRRDGLDGETCFITWVPDSWTLAMLRHLLEKEGDAQKVKTIVYPGYGLTPAEIDDLEPAIKGFTPQTELKSFEDYL